MCIFIRTIIFYKTPRDAAENKIEFFDDDTSEGYPDLSLNLVRIFCNFTNPPPFDEGWMGGPARNVCPTYTDLSVKDFRGLNTRIDR